MPLNAHPPTVDAAAFRAKLDAATAAAVTDFALLGRARARQRAADGRAGGARRRRLQGVHVRRAESTTSRPPTTGRCCEGMAEAARLDLPVAVHAESAEMTAALAARATGSGWRDYTASRPVEAELEAIARAIRPRARPALLAPCRPRLHRPRRPARDRAARARGVDVTCETCPHYFVLDEDDLEALGAIAKCAPPLRSRADRDDLRAELAAGAVDLLASDHSPAPPALKEGDDAFAVWGGISGCQSLVVADARAGCPARARHRAAGGAFPPAGQGPPRARRRRRHRARDSAVE